MRKCKSCENFQRRTNKGIFYSILFYSNSKLTFNWETLNLGFNVTLHNLSVESFTLTSFSSELGDILWSLGEDLVSWCFEGSRPWNDWFRRTFDAFFMVAPSMMIGLWVGLIGSTSVGREGRWSDGVLEDDQKQGCQGWLQFGSYWPQMGQIRFIITFGLLLSQIWHLWFTYLIN